MPRIKQEVRTDAEFLSELSQLSERMAQARSETSEAATDPLRARKFVAQSIAAQKLAAQNLDAQKLAEQSSAQSAEATSPNADAPASALPQETAAPATPPAKSAAPRSASLDSVKECQPPTANGHFSLLHSACANEYREQFRLLRTQLLLHRGRFASPSDFRVVAVMSTNKGEGKSFTASNLAAVLASAAGQRVLLIDADPISRALTLGTPSKEPRGLSRALLAPAEWPQLIHRVRDTSLYVMARGAVSASGTTNLEPLPRLISALRDHFDWIIVDGSAFASCADAPWLASVADGSLLVVRESVSSFGAVHDSIASIPPDRLVGIVFNERKPPPKPLLRIRFKGRKSAPAA
jgi:protein-tyrosine kinase